MPIHRPTPNTQHRPPHKHHLNPTQQVHENFRVLSEADTVLRKGLHHTHHHHNPRPSGAGDNDDGHDDEGREHEQHHPEEEEVEPAGGEHLEHAGEETASLAAYLETVDRVQEALRFLRRNPRMRSAEVASRQLELKQQKLLADMRAEAHRVLASRSRCALAYVPVAGGGMDYQAGDPIPPSAARRVRALVDALLRAGDTRWAEQAYVKARRAKLEGALRPFLEQQRQVLMGGKGAGGLERERAVSGFFSGGEDALGVTGTVGRGSVAMGAGAMMSVRVASSTAGAGAEGEWVRYLQFLRELVKGA